MTFARLREFLPHLPCTGGHPISSHSPDEPLTSLYLEELSLSELLQTSVLAVAPPSPTTGATHKNDQRYKARRAGRPQELSP
jgi:hypothetical protein